MKLVGIGLLALGAVRLLVALKGSFAVPLAGGYQANVQLEPESGLEKAVTVGLIGGGLLLVFGPKH